MSASSAAVARKIGLAGILFFTAKGLVWLAVAGAAYVASGW